MAKRVIRRKRTRAADHQETKKGASHRRTHAEEPESTGHNGSDGSAVTENPVIEVRGKPFPTHCTRPRNPSEWATMKIRPRNRPRSSLDFWAGWCTTPPTSSTYGAVYPVALVAGLIPSENALVYGLLDGASDAQEAAGRWKTSRRSMAGGARPALTGEPA